MHIHPGAEPQTDVEKAVVGFLDDWGPGAWPHMLECSEHQLPARSPPRTREVAAAGLEGVIVETNFCKEIDKPSTCLDLLAGLAPVLEAAKES